MTNDAQATAFHDLDAYMAMPRVAGLVLSPDGTRLVTTVSTLDPERTTYVTALWEVDPAGQRPPNRLTRGAKGEAGAAFLPDGGLLFVSARPDPEAKAADKDSSSSALWHVPASGGEARVVATRPGGVAGVVVARETGTIVMTSDTLPASGTAEDDEKRRKHRKERKISAILHESYPVRYWDHDLGPGMPRLLAGSVPETATAAESGRATLRDLTPYPGRSLDEAEYDLTPDGRTVVTTWQVPERGGRRVALVAIDVATGERRILLDDVDHEYASPVISPDGRRVAVCVWVRSTAEEPPCVRLGIVDLSGVEELRIVAPGWDRWPSRPAWVPDGTALVVTADSGGRAPVYRIDLDTTGSVTRLTGDHGCYSDVRVSPDRLRVYALRSAHDAPPAPVRLELATPDQEPTYLPSPAPAPTLPGTLTEVTATADDGTPVRGWLCLPDGAGPQTPAPLVLWIHGGPLGSANAWAWRWNPWLLVAQGYAVLDPDFALSTGYGQDFIRRGWGQWGGAPFTDLMTITDAAEARADLDPSRTAAMGGSFGGYMANWVAGHTDRFRGIVTHASLWALDQFGPTTDGYDYWRREMTAEMALANSPHRFVEQIRTPMLVIHGDNDYRVPIGEALRLWAELAEHSAEPDGAMPHKFLYFPDENHWILTPEHAKVWYLTVLAFLATTVHGQEWKVPDILR